MLPPCEPKESVRELIYPFGKAQGHFFDLRTEYADLGFSYANLPLSVEKLETLKIFFDNARDGLVTSSKGRLLEEKELSVEGHPGRILKLELPSGDTIRQKVLVVGSHVYQMMFISKDKGMPPSVLKYNEVAASRYFESFTLR